MKCLHPWHDEKRQVWFNCGKCVNCRANKGSQWKLRCIYELDAWDSAIFVTLTYNDEWLLSHNISPQGFPTLKKETPNYSLSVSRQTSVITNLVGLYPRSLCVESIVRNRRNVHTTMLLSSVWIDTRIETDNTLLIIGVRLMPKGVTYGNSTEQEARRMESRK